MYRPLTSFPCPCCGYLVFEHQPGSHGVCPICRWEDDLAQLRFVKMPGVANTTSLIIAQKNYAEYGASSRRTAGLGRSPLEGDTREASWRVIDPATDNLEYPAAGIDYSDSYPLRDTTVLYYWRPCYWRRYAS